MEEATSIRSTSTGTSSCRCSNVIDEEARAIHAALGSLPMIAQQCTARGSAGHGDGTPPAAREDVLVTRLVMGWTGLAASILLVVAALTNRSGTCADSANAAASSCSTTGSGGMLLVGVAAFGLSLWMLRRAHRTRRR